MSKQHQRACCVVESHLDSYVNQTESSLHRRTSSLTVLLIPAQLPAWVRLMSSGLRITARAKFRRKRHVDVSTKDGEKARRDVCESQSWLASKKNCICIVCESQMCLSEHHTTLNNLFFSMFSSDLTVVPASSLIF